MTFPEIERLVARGETETLELKKSTAELQSTGQVLCGFLNANGGRVIVGITPGRRIIGQLVADDTLRDIANSLRKLEPPASIDLQRVGLPGKAEELIILEAQPLRETMPFTYDGRAYQRIGTTTSVMPQERYQRLLLERMHSRRRWENEPADGVRIEDLDVEEILRTARSGIAAGRLPEVTGTDPVDILHRFGVAADGQPMNAAVVLFGTRFLPYYTQCGLRMARFRGIDKSEFLDNRQIHGHAIRLLEESMDFLMRHLPVAGKIVPGILERQDKPLFPPDALREALVNGLCHRDYIDGGGAVSVAIFDDRVEIWSTGKLPFDLTVEDLKRDHKSRPRNPLIAGVFYRRGLIEQWGRGTQKIVRLCVEAGHPEPEFVEQTGELGVRFLPSGYVPPLRVDHDLTERQREILMLLSRAPRMAFREIRSALAVFLPERTLRDDLQHLRRLGLIGSAGRARTAVWFLRHE